MLTLLLPLLLVQGAPAQGVQVVPPVKLVARSSNAQALSPDGKELAFNVEFHGMHHYRDDISVRLISLSTGKVRLSVPGFDPWIDGLAWSLDGSVVAVVGHDGAVRVIRSSDGVVEAEFPAPPEIVRPCSMPCTAVFVDGGAKLLIAGAGSAIQLRDREGGRFLTDFLLQPNVATSAICVSKDRLHFAAGDLEGSLAVYSARTGKLEAGPFSAPKPVNSLAFDPGETRLAVGSGDCQVRVVPLRPDAAAATLSHCDEDLGGDLAIGCVEFSPDGKNLLATSFSFWEVRLWSLDSGSVLWPRHDFGGGNPVRITAHFAADPSVVVVAPGGEVVDAATGKNRHDFGINLSGNDGFYAWAAGESKLRVWDVRDGKLVAEVDLREPVPK